MNSVLDQFFGAYFHQDWADDHNEWTEVVDEFTRESPPTVLRETLEALRALLSTAGSEEQLRCDVQRLGCYYTPRPDLGGLSYREWVESVRQRIQSEVHGGGAA